MEAETNVQAKDNSPSIERILRPITYTSWLLGVGVAHPRKCPKAITIIIRIIHLALCFFGVMYNAYLFGVGSENNIFEYVSFLNNVMCYVSAYYYIYHGIREYNKWPELMDRLKELDQKIKKEISMNDRSIKIVAVLAIFATFTICPLILIIHFLYYYFTSPTFQIYFYMLDLPFYHMLSQSLINSFVFDVVVYVLYCRFQTINKLIGQLDELSDALWIAFKIRRIRELHTDICDLVNMVNDSHGLHLLFCSANCFTMAVATLFKLYIIVMKKDYTNIMINNSHCIVYVTQFYLICWICTLAHQESSRTGRIIYKILLNCKPDNLDKHKTRNQLTLVVRSPLNDLDDDQSSNCSSNHNLSYVRKNFLRRNLDRECVTKEINDFSSQLQQLRVAFTANDFFEINNALFKSFVGVIITYLIIFIQLHRQLEDLPVFKTPILRFG